VPSFLLDGKVSDAQIVGRMKQVDDVIRKMRRDKKNKEKGQRVFGYIM